MATAVERPNASDLPVPRSRGPIPKPSGSPGSLAVLDWAGFRGAVSFTFDDGNSSQLEAYAALQRLGVKYTFYIQTGKREARSPVWRQAVLDGHELGNHTRSHSSVDDGTDTDAATRFLQRELGVTPRTMAAPNGSASYTEIARSRFLINRGVANALIAPNDDTDPFTLPCYVPEASESAALMQSQIDSARAGRGWRVLLVHGFEGGSDAAYQPIALADFTATVEHAKANGDLWIDTVLNIGAYWRAQALFARLRPRSSGNDHVWSWTLPEHFPPGKYLRVTVEGGTLRQAGHVLPWNEVGYYEVALDAGALTLSP